MEEKEEKRRMSGGQKRGVREVLEGAHASGSTVAGNGGNGGSTLQKNLSNAAVAATATQAASLAAADDKHDVIKKGKMLEFNFVFQGSSQRRG